MRVTLPKACIGPCEITAHYSIPSSPDGNLRVPLVMPLDAELAGNNVLVMPGAEQQVEVAPGVWTAVEAGLNPAASPPPTSGYPREFAAGQRTADIVLKLHGESGTAAVTVDCAWIQTCVASSVTATQGVSRQDRVVWQFTTRRRELQITMPEGAADQVSVELNSVPVTPRARRRSPGHPLVRRRSAALRAQPAILFPSPASGHAASETLACWSRSHEIRFSHPR